MAFHQYDIIYGGKDITTFEGEPRIVSVKLGKVELTNELGVHDPCGAPSSSPDTDKAWGCNFFMKQRRAGVRVIAEGLRGAKYSLDNLSGGKPKVSSIGVCTLAKVKRMGMNGSQSNALEVDMSNIDVLQIDLPFQE